MSINETYATNERFIELDDPLGSHIDLGKLLTQHQVTPPELKGHDGTFRMLCAGDPSPGIWGLIAQVVSVREIEIDGQTYLQWILVGLPGTDCHFSLLLVVAWCLPEFHPGSTLWDWAEAVLHASGGIPADARELDTETLIDRQCQLYPCANGSLAFWALNLTDSARESEKLARRLESSKSLQPYAPIIRHLWANEDMLQPTVGLGDVAEWQVLEWLHHKIAVEMADAKRAHDEQRHEYALAIDGLQRAPKGADQVH